MNHKNVMRATLLLAASAGAMIAGAAQAQDAAQAPDNTAPPTSTQPPANVPTTGDVVVTGTRAALEGAERVKRDADVVLDGISANDIGALPDASMSEAVIRIPGAYANDNGALSARGLGPDFIQQEINGRIIPSPAAGTRRVQTGSFPTEGITGIYLQKTPDAGTIEGGAGGSVLLETIHPLETSRKGLEVVVRGYSNTNSAKLSDADGYANIAPRVSATLIKRLAPNLGIAFTFAHVSQYNASIQNDGSAWRLGTAPRVDLNGDGVPDALPQTLGEQVNATNDFRDSIVSMIQWDPTSSVRLSLDGFYNNDHFQNLNRRFFAFTLFQGNNGPVNSATVNQYNSVVAMNANAGGYRGIVNYAEGNDKTYGGGLNVAFDDGGPISFKVDGSYYKATRRQENPNFTFENDSTSAVTAGQRLPFSYDVTDPFNSVYNFQPLTPEDYALASGSYGIVHVDDTIAALAADFTYKPSSDDGILKSIQFGGRVDRRHKLSRPSGTAYTFGCTNATCTPAASAVNYTLRPDLDSSYLASATNPLAGHNPYVSGTGQGAWPLFDIDKLVGLVTSPYTVATSQPAVVNGYIDNTENTMALYGQLNFHQGFLSGNIGTRYIQTDGHIKGLQGSLTSNSLATFSNSYHYLLPELNLKLQFTPKFLGRIGLSKTLSRPNFDDSKVAASFDPVVAVQNGFATINAGNPNLKPYTAKGIDATLEWYPARSTSISVAGYIKYVDGFLRNVTQSGTVVLTDGTVLPATISTQINDTQTRRFAGIELQARQELTFLPGFLSGLGVYANWNRSFTNAVENVGSLLMGPTVDVTANNFAKNIVNAQIYYSKGPIDLRVAYRYFSTNAQTALAPVNYRVIPGGTLDVSGGFDINRNVRALFSVTNVLYKGVRTYLPDYRYPANNYQTNQSLLLGTNNAGMVIQAGIRAHF